MKIFLIYAKSIALIGVMFYWLGFLLPNAVSGTDTTVTVVTLILFLSIMVPLFIFLGRDVIQDIRCLPSSKEKSNVACVKSKSGCDSSDSGNSV